MFRSFLSSGLRSCCTTLAIAFMVALLGLASHARSEGTLDETSALERARELRVLVDEGNSGSLWDVFDEPMREAMRGYENFAALMEKIHGSVGPIQEVIDEDVHYEGGRYRYRAVCRFEKAPEPFVIKIALAGDGRVSGMTIQPEPRAYPSPRLDYVPETRLSVPWAGEWFIVWGGRTIEENHHAAHRTQRFAVDAYVLEDGVSHTGDGLALTDYHAFGRELFAPADGVVVEVEDSHPDQEIGSSDAAHPYGNFVVIDHGNGEYSLLAHLQAGSVEVASGDRVARGDVLGRCGNSGNTTEPHAHYQLQDGVDRNASDGLPVVFAHALVDGEPAEAVEPLKGQTIGPLK